MIGLLPCAGTAERFNGLQKFLLPCPGGYLIQCHTDAMKKTGCEIVRVGYSGHGDVLKRYSPGTYNYIARQHHTMTATVLSASKFVRDKDKPVLFGMPDTFFDFPLVYERLATRLNESNTDVVLAVFKARPEQYRQGGMVSISHNKVVDIVDKPEATHLQYIWGAMAWRARFWSCLTPDMTPLKRFVYPQPID